MWLFTRYGFFSVVLDPSIKPEHNSHGVTAHYNVSIRSRVKKDLLLLLELPTALRAAQPEIVELKNRDYPYRIYASREELQELMQFLANDLDYDNFKNMVDRAKGMGPERHDLYSRVWGVMHDAEAKLKEMVDKAKAFAALPPLADDGWFAPKTQPPRMKSYPAKKVTKGKKS